MKILLLLSAILFVIFKNRITNEIKYSDLFVYTILFGVLFKVVLTTEQADLTCPQGPYTKNKSVCKHGNGKLVQVAKYERKDDVSTTLKKMNMLIKNKHTQVYWRRSFILAVIVSFFGNYILSGSFPDGRNLILLFIVVYLASSSLNSFYVHHNDKVFDEKIVQGLVKINKIHNSN